MKTTGRSPDPIPVEVLPPEGRGFPSSGEVQPPPPQGPRTFYHPASGAAILGVDLLAFGSEALSGFLDTPAACLLAFAVTFVLVYLIQNKWSRDRPALSFAKAFFGAFLAGLPFSIAGGIFGALILALSGLPHPKTLVKDAIFQRIRKR